MNYTNYIATRTLIKKYKVVSTSEVLAENEEEARKLIEGGLKESRQRITTMRPGDGIYENLLSVEETIDIKEA